ncbi:unnamed protein product, partial [Amoebophrya sp. A25]
SKFVENYGAVGVEEEEEVDQNRQEALREMLDDTEDAIALANEVMRDSRKQRSTTRKKESTTNVNVDRRQEEDVVLGIAADDVDDRDADVKIGEHQSFSLVGRERSSSAVNSRDTTTTSGAKEPRKTSKARVRRFLDDRRSS